MFTLVAVAIIIAFFLLYWTASVLYSRFGWFKRFFHDTLDWHCPDPSIVPYYDSGRVHTRCKYCNEDIVKDSSGNWF